MTGWNVIADTHLHDVLTRAHHGEDPDLLMLELYANADHGQVRAAWWRRVLGWFT